MNTRSAHKKLKKVLLACGIIASLLYPITDMFAGNLYKGYSFNEQAVSELFAIGAATSQMVVIFFSISSSLFMMFAIGVWLSSHNSRILRALSIMIFANAINSLILWNFFPMHMRGVQATFTDTMHAILAINPFILASIILGAIYFRNWFRIYSIATILLLLVTAIKGFSYVPPLIANQPTPGLGIAERVAQYAHQMWHAVLAVVLLLQSKLNRKATVQQQGVIHRRIAGNTTK